MSYYERVPVTEPCQCGAGARAGAEVSVPNALPAASSPSVSVPPATKNSSRTVILGIDVDVVKTHARNFLSWISERARPLKEFLKIEDMKLPDVTTGLERIRINLGRFYYNYVGIFVGAAVVTALNHPITGLICGAVAYWMYEKKKRPVLSPYSIPVVLVGVATGFVGHIAASIAFSSTVVIAHAALMSTQTAEQEEAVPVQTARVEQLD